MHAEMKIGDSIHHDGGADGEAKAKPCSLYLHVADVDCRLPARDPGGWTSWGTEGPVLWETAAGRDRSVRQLWGSAPHIEDVSHAEMEKRFRGHGRQAVGDFEVETADIAWRCLQ